MTQPQHPNQRCLTCRYRTWAWLATLLLLAACNPAPVGLEQVADYRQRVANTLKSPLPAPVLAAPTWQLPPLRELRIEVPSQSLSLLDAIRLDQCQAGSLIAERNSSLGKLQQGLVRYYHDYQLLQALYICAAQLEQQGQLELAQKVSDLSRNKAANMTQLKLQALVSDPSIRQSLRLADRPLAKVDPAQLAPLLTALQQVYLLLNAPLPAPNAAFNQEQQSELSIAPVALDELEQALQLLEQSPYLSQLWRALYDQQQYLQQLTPLVQDLSAAAGCLSAGTPSRALVLRNVFVQYFSGPVQQHFAGLIRQAQQIAPLLTMLDSPEAPQAWLTHLRQINALPDQLTDTTRNHVRYWQQFFSDCGFTPGA